MAAMLGRRSFCASPAEVREARRWLRSLLGDGCSDALVCLSEVFTNAVIHTASGAMQRPVSVVVTDVGPCFHIEVTDAGAVTRPQMRCPDDSTLHGRGLHVVNALTGGRWGWVQHQMGLTVWFEVPR
jgi:anti-sigma regulatory factor (Ser/Thr protein kinase)